MPEQSAAVDPFRVPHSAASCEQERSLTQVPVVATKVHLTAELERFARERAKAGTSTMIVN